MKGAGHHSCRDDETTARHEAGHNGLLGRSLAVRDREKEVRMLKLCTIHSTQSPWKSNREVLWAVDEVRTSQELSKDAGQGRPEVSFCEDAERPYFHDPFAPL